MVENWRRILVGLATAYAIGFLSIYLLPTIELTGPSIDRDMSSWVLRAAAFSSALAFITYAVGGYIARTNFLLPAIVLELSTFTYGFLRGFFRSPGSNRTADNDSDSLGTLDLWSELGAYDFWQIMVWPTLPILVGPIIATAAGALVGMKLYGVLKSRTVAFRT